MTAGEKTSGGDGDDHQMITHQFSGLKLNEMQKAL